MDNIREKYIIGFSLIVFGYLVWRVNNTFYDSIYDHILVNFILLCLWYINFSYRDFVMTLGKLNNYYPKSRLEYKCLRINNIIKDIYVRVFDYDDWYKLDYSLTIPNNVNNAEYDKFVSNNVTVSDLIKSMSIKKDDIVIGGRYRIMCSNYQIFKYMTLIFYIIFEFFYWMIYINYNIKMCESDILLY